MLNMMKEFAGDKKHQERLLALMVGRTKRLLKKGKKRIEIANTLRITLDDADELIDICNHAEANRKKHAATD